MADRPTKATPKTAARVTEGRAGARRSDPFRFDRSCLAAHDQGATVLAGADEVGRGSLAGPLVAVALTLDYRDVPGRSLRGLTDSKALTVSAREALYPSLLTVARRICVVCVSPERIDERGLHRSNLDALARALEGLEGAYDLALVDGFALGRPDLRAQPLRGGDWRSATVAAASVVAKVVRDRLMRSLDALYPDYGFADHVGYATTRHREALTLLGPCALHRLSFASVAGADFPGEQGDGPFLGHSDRDLSGEET